MKDPNTEPKTIMGALEGATVDEWPWPTIVMLTIPDGF
jgi:hypothetical protein